MRVIDRKLLEKLEIIARGEELMLRIFILKEPQFTKDFEKVTQIIICIEAGFRELVCAKISKKTLYYASNF